MREIIIAESNFLARLIWEIYVGKREFDRVAYDETEKRLQAIRDEARKIKD